MKVTIDIDDRAIKAINVLTSNGLNGDLEDNINWGLRYLICNYYQYIPFMKQFPQWIEPIDPEYTPTI